ncbi:MAG: manganese efflux pump MntP family protein [Oscillospiraceae bacterium]|nr:manganese efflux pump MntP family protein [Oscillospiraceae bacterium]
MLGSILTEILLGASLSMDAFAVTVGEGLACPRDGLKNALKHSVYFGFFQALMPLIGFLLAGTVSGKIMSLGPYISFFLLVFVGGKMLIDALKGNQDEEKNCDASSGDFSHPKAIVLALATSIDALAVGVSFAFTETNIFLMCAIIGVTTFVICALGGLLCSRLPKGSGRTAGVAGGAVLIGIGIKLLIEGAFLK